MKLTLRTLATLPEALALTPLADLVATEFHEQISDAPFPAGATERFLRAHFEARETVVIVAEGPDRAWGMCWTGPFTDPLLGTTLPMIVILHVDPALRHRNVASELVREAEKVLRERGLTQLLARAPHNDDARISMGERWGFVRSWELMIKE